MQRKIETTIEILHQYIRKIEEMINKNLSFIIIKKEKIDRRKSANIKVTESIKQRMRMR